jgi:hypothetical protein
MSGPDGSDGASGPAPVKLTPRRSLFIVERRLPKITDHQLTMLQAALTDASSRFIARGEDVSYLRSIFMSRQERLLSLFSAASIEVVRAVNEAALVPFTSIEPALEMAGPDEAPGV